MLGINRERSTPCTIALVAMTLSTAACNLLTGADGYEEVDRCTGPMCGVCPAGQRWYAASDSCVPSCSEGTSECGASCCGFGLYCVTEASKSQRCSACETAASECGQTCCEATATCTDDELGVCWSPYGVAGQSCAGGLTCAGGGSCCESIEIPGGTFPMGSPDWEGYEAEHPEHAVTVSSYSLDKYEVTVGRFRRFVENWDYQPPPPGAGAHPRIPGSGWRSAWNERLPTTHAELESRLQCENGSTWSLSQGLDDTLPVNCVSWYEAFAFCAWDGGRLPTEAEWEYAAAGGDEDWPYPWGSAPPTYDLAVYYCAFGGTPGACSSDDLEVPVGSAPGGAGRWGHHDLAGSMWEWVLDVYDVYSNNPCNDCANAVDAPIRVKRGGSWSNGAENLRAAGRLSNSPSNHGNNYGLRCARTP